MLQLTKDVSLAVMPALRKRMETINARLAKLGLESCELRIESVRAEPMASSDAVRRFRQIATVTLTGPEARVGNHEMMARIDHRTQPARFRFFSDEASLPRRYLDAKSYCEHCRIQRQRNTTFVLYDHEGDVHVQVGGSCLKDFLEVSPAQLLKTIALLESALEALNEASASGPGGWNIPEPSLVSLDEYLPFVAQSIRTNGWLGARAEASAGAKATWWHARQLMAQAAETGTVAAPQDVEAARAARKKVDREVSRDTYYDEYWGNLAEIAREDLVDERRLAFAALIVRESHREAEQQAREAEAANSEFFGEASKRLECEVTVLSVTPLMGGRYGTKWLHRMRTADGDLAVWFGSRTHALLDKGNRVYIRATVKGHETYKGVRQTELTRLMPLALVS